ncbi:unnamed protein product [Symbiodinium natans]|uniref:EamA domain-containing protein n=1 Tax=Symbiodinium natans TaxID=878477 RepID=A0A812J9V5_9DINO|nr:unnamed protein product [Symbiodinium natans]
MAFSTELIGILLMAASGLAVTCEMVTSKIIEDMHWPYWYLLAACCAVATIANGFVLWWQGVGCPQVQDVKWILARALFENLHWMLAIYAVLVGAAPGDVAALTSIDIIAAALLGLLFLGERVSVVHFVALVLSVTGAICISQPQFLFGIVEGSKQSPLGYCLAMLAGCFQAGAFVCARKSAHLPVSLLTVVSLFLTVPLAFVPPCLSPGADSMDLVMEKPWEALGLLSMMTAWVLFSILLPAAGATRCPAAVSATVFTSSSMISGYLAQTVLFDDVPKPLKLFGAACMLFSVVMMAVRCQRDEEPEPSCADCSAEPAPGPEASVAEEDDETMSLGSFVASEVSFTSSSRSLRRRISTGSSKPLPQRLGACLPVVSLSQLSA